MIRLPITCILVLMYSFLNGEETICPVLADNSIAAHISELNENTGESKSVKIKGSENYPIFKFDLSQVPMNAKIERAELTIQLTNENMSIRQIGYSTIPVNWEEGKGAKPQEKSHEFSCSLGAFGPASGWGKPGLRFLNVISGNAGNVCGVLLAEKVGGKFKLTFPGRVFASIKKDQIGGLTLSDESGWWGGEMSNIYFHSREAGELGPSLKVFWTKSIDIVAPSAPRIKQLGLSDKDGEVLIEIVSGGDDGVVGMALGFEMRFTEEGTFDWNKATELPRLNTPRQNKALFVARF